MLAILALPSTCHRTHAAYYYLPALGFTTPSMKVLCGMEFALLLMLVACAAETDSSKRLQVAPRLDPTYDEKLGKEGTIDPGSMKTDVITCKLKDCDHMCVCQKIVWELYMRPGLEKQPATTMCQEWAEGKRMEESCIPKCVALAHLVYAVAGTDENVCLSAVAEVRVTIPSFKAIKATLKRVAKRSKARKATKVTKTALRRRGR